jgi:hypothetical protein
MNYAQLTDEQIVIELKKYFGIKEFVDKATYEKYGEKCWQFMCPRLLLSVLIIRVELDKSITINDWAFVSGGRQQRGLRANTCSIVKKKTDAGRLYLSAHVEGKAVDMTVKGMEAEAVRNWIKDNLDLFPFKIRVEHKKNGTPIGWVDLDVYSHPDNPKMYWFDV